MPGQLPLLLLILVTLSTLATTTSPVVTTRLEQIQVIFLNGERTPRTHESYPFDPYGSPTYYAPWGGRGRLTESGRERARRLGQVLRRSYTELLVDLGPEEVRSYSAEHPGGRESLGLVLGALLGLDEGEVPVAIIDDDPRLRSRGLACLEYREELERVRRSAEVRRELDRFDGLYR